MAALSEKLLWPIVGIFIFGILAGFYIDDRRRVTEEGTNNKQEQASSKEHGGKKADNKHASKEHAGDAAKSKEHADQAAENKSAEKARTKARAKASSNTNTADTRSTGATSMSMDEYLASSSSERGAELEANASHHQGFSGGIDEYLSGSKPKGDEKSHAEHAGKSAEHAGKSAEKKSSHQASGATSMSMEEYQANSAQGQHGSSMSSSDAYHGDMEGYLAKYGDGKQTAVSNSADKPFNKKEHMGFHGSYEDYAKKYN